MYPEGWNGGLDQWMVCFCKERSKSLWLSTNFTSMIKKRSHISLGYFPKDGKIKKESPNSLF